MNITFKIEETDRFSIKAELLRSTQYIEIVCPDDKQIIELFRNMKEESRCKSTNWMWFEAISSNHGTIVHEFDVFRMDIVTSLRWNDFVVNLIGEEFQIDPLGESEKIVFTLKRRIEFVLDTYREFVLRKPIITTFTPCVAPYSSVILKPWTEALPKDLSDKPDLNKTSDRCFDHPGDIDIEDLLLPEEVPIIRPEYPRKFVEGFLNIPQNNTGGSYNRTVKVEELTSGVGFSYMTDEDEVKFDTATRVSSSVSPDPNVISEYTAKPTPSEISLELFNKLNLSKSDIESEPRHPEEVTHMTEEGIHTDEGIISFDQAMGRIERISHLSNVQGSTGNIHEIMNTNKTLHQKELDDQIVSLGDSVEPISARGNHPEVKITATLCADGNPIKLNPTPESLIIDETEPKLEHLELIESISDLPDEDKQYMPGLMNDLNALRQICIVNAETNNTGNLVVEHFDSPNDQDVPAEQDEILFGTIDTTTACFKIEDMKEKVTSTLALSLTEQGLSEQNCITLDSTPEDLIVNAEEMEELAPGAKSEVEAEFSPEQKYIKFVLINQPVWSNASLQSLYKTGVQEYLDSPDHKVFLDFRENSWISDMLNHVFYGTIGKNSSIDRSVARPNMGSVDIEFQIRGSEKFMARVHFNDKVGVGCVTINQDAECLSHLIDFITISK